MRGKLYGVGVGPGDPELMTLKSVRIIGQSDVIIFAGKSQEESQAFKIISEEIDGLDSKQLIPLDVPMTSDKSVLDSYHKKLANEICRILDESKDIAFITLGDVSIYSTFAYIKKIVKKRGYEVLMVSGIPSFVAAASTVGISLTEWDEGLEIIPAIYNSDVKLKPNKSYVFMKAGNKLESIKELLEAHERDGVMIVNCGMKNEKIYEGIKNFPSKADYLSLIISSPKI